MAKDINIHVKTTGTGQSASELNQVAQATEEMGAKTSRAAGWIKEAFTALVGPLGITAVVGFVVAGVRNIIAAFDDMKRASSEAVHNLANLQREAASYFEAMDAYSGPQRKAALAQAMGVQASTGLPLNASMQLLEAQKRTFGEINPQATQQFAAYWQLHTGPQTSDLIRWMGASGIKTPEQQGQIMRMISAVADKSNLQEEDIITAISARSERFRAMGWTPEQTIMNIGKALSGVSPLESGKAMRGMFEAMEGFDEAKAREMKVPRKIAASEQARLEWLKNKAAGLPLEQRNALLRQAFGPSYPYVSKMLFEPTSPELQQAITSAVGPQGAEEASRQAEQYKATAEGQVEIAAGIGGQFKIKVPPIEQTKTQIRDIGRDYLEFLRYKDRVAYEKITKTNFGTQAEYEAAAIHLWFTTLSEDEKKKYIELANKEMRGLVQYENFPETAAGRAFRKLPPQEQFSKVREANENPIIVNNYDNSTNYLPRVGESEPRMGREAR